MWLGILWVLDTFSCATLCSGQILWCTTRCCTSILGLAAPPELAYSICSSSTVTWELAWLLPIGITSLIIDPCILDPFKGLHNVLYKSKFQKPLVSHIWGESLVHVAASAHLCVICCHSSCLKNVTVSRPCGLLEVNHNRASCTS